MGYFGLLFFSMSWSFLVVFVRSGGVPESSLVVEDKNVDLQKSFVVVLCI